jgi:protein ImuB
MLWACLHLPHLPLEAHARADAGTRALVVASADHRPRVIDCNAVAGTAGVQPGMSITAALALAPELIVQPRNPALETQALHGVAAWSLQFTPAISLDPPDALLLEVGGGVRLFGGLAPLVDLVRAGLAAIGHTAVVAAAPTPTAALLLARAGVCRTITATDTLAQELAPLPLAACRLALPVLETLADLGTATFGALAGLPRDGLARRFGQPLVDMIDRALGRLPDARLPHAAPESFRERLVLPAPARETEALLFALKRLLAILAGWLLGRGLGAMRLALELEHEDHPTTTLSLDLSTPSRDPAHLALLMRERLARAGLPNRVEAVALATLETAPLGARPRSLFADDSATDGGELIERLVARLGEEAVCSLRVHADHRPELAWREHSPGPADTPAQAAPRPLWLLPEPLPLDRFDAGSSPPVLTDGPERIESGWWEGRDVRRDYFVARTARGQTLWIYRQRDADRAWYVHGIFA